MLVIASCGHTSVVARNEDVENISTKDNAAMWSTGRQLCDPLPSRVAKTLLFLQMLEEFGDVPADSASWSA